MENLRISRRQVPKAAGVTGGASAVMGPGMVHSRPNRQRGPFSDWSEPVNLGPVINATSDDFHPAMPKNGVSRYITSKRAGGVNSGGNLVRGHQLHARRRTLFHALMVGAALSSMHNRALAIEPDKEKRPETPIHHVVIFFQENQSFDHYFGTYPNAANLDGEMGWIGIPAPRFIARDDTPSINGIPPSLLVNNPNITKTGAQANPRRLRPADAYTCTMNHGYSAEQQAVHSGLADRFP